MQIALAWSSEIHHYASDESSMEDRQEHYYPILEWAISLVRRDLFYHHLQERSEMHLGSTFFDLYSQ